MNAKQIVEARRDAELGREAYIAQLVEQLTDLGAKRMSSSSLTVAGMRVYVEDNSHRHVFRVDVHAGRTYTARGGRGGTHRFTNVALAHVAAQVRRLVEAQALRHEARKIEAARETERREREEAASAAVMAAVERHQAAAAAAGEAQTVTACDVGEYAPDVYRFSMRLQWLTEAQALAVLAVIEQK